MNGKPGLLTGVSMMRKIGEWEILTSPKTYYSLLQK